MSADGVVKMIVVDGVRYRPEEAEALGLVATEAVPVEDVTPPSRKLTQEQQERLQEIFDDAEAIEAERDLLSARVASLETERDLLKEELVELKENADTQSAQEPVEDEAAPAAKTGAVTTKTATPRNKAAKPDADKGA